MRPQELAAKVAYACLHALKENGGEIQSRVVLKRKWDFISGECPLHGDDLCSDPLGCIEVLVCRDRFPVTAPNYHHNANQEDQQ